MELLADFKKLVPNLLLYLYLILIPLSTYAQDPIRISLTLSEVETAALKHSHTLAAARVESHAAQHGANVQYSFEVLPSCFLRQPSPYLP